MAVWDVVESKWSECHLKGNHPRYNILYTIKKSYLIPYPCPPLDLEFFEGGSCFLPVSSLSPVEGLKGSRSSANIYWMNVWRKNNAIKEVCMRGEGNQYQSHNQWGYWQLFSSVQFSHSVVSNNFVLRAYSWAVGFRECGGSTSRTNLWKLTVCPV